MPVSGLTDFRDLRHVIFTQEILHSQNVQLRTMTMTDLIQPTPQQKLIDFLEKDLDVPTNAIAIGLRHQEAATPLPDNLLPMVLWQYGLITTAQLDQVFDWLETA